MAHEIRIRNIYCGIRIRAIASSSSLCMQYGHCYGGAAACMRYMRINSFIYFTMQEKKPEGNSSNFYHSIFSPLQPPAIAECFQFLLIRLHANLLKLFFPLEKINFFLLNDFVHWMIPQATNTARSIYLWMRNYAIIVRHHLPVFCSQAIGISATAWPDADLSF